MRLIGSWGRGSLIVGGGKRGGELDGRMGDVIKNEVRMSYVSLLCLIRSGVEAWGETQAISTH
jgi:hypothetical protein